MTKGKPVTGPKAGGGRLFRNRAPLTAHVGKFWRSAPKIFLCKVFSVLLFLLPATCSAQGTSGGGMNLVGNGSFESVNFTPDVNLSPWVWSTCLSLIIAEPQHVADGSNCAIVCGRIYQNVAVVPSMLYQLRFAFGGDDGAQSNLEPLTVSWGAQTIAAIPVDPVSMQSPNWRYLTFNVLATDSTMRLGFSTLPGQAFPLIDNVSLTPVPEPSVLALLALATTWGLATCRWVRDRLFRMRMTCFLPNSLCSECADRVLVPIGNPRWRIAKRTRWAAGPDWQLNTKTNV